MPTMQTALALDGLLQYSNKESIGKKFAKRSDVFYSPALYATPEVAPIPDVSSIAYSPNIYVANHKRRDRPPRPVVSSPVEGFEKEERDVVDGGDVIDLSDFSGKGKEEDVEIGEELNDEFIDLRDSLNVGTSGGEVDDGDSLGYGRLEKQLDVKLRSQDEYYDSAEDFFSECSFSSSSPSKKRSSEHELRLLKLSLIEESSKRKVAEGNLLYLNKQYEKLQKCLSHSRSSLPVSLDLLNLKNEIGDPSEIFQEFVVLKFVFEALEADLAKAEVEEAFTEIIVTKDHEMSRLRDRMMYYEAMNREISQRNLEAVDLARKQRLKRQRMRRWIWSCVGLSITAGASLLAYSYLPYHGNDGSSAPSSDASTGITE